MQSCIELNQLSVNCLQTNVKALRKAITIAFESNFFKSHHKGLNVK